MTSAPRTSFIEANGIRQAIHDWGGDGVPVVLVHGTRFLGRLWDPVARGLLPDYRPIAIDRRGHGDSEKPPAGYGRVDSADDLVAALRVLGLQRPLTIGHSVGAITVLMASGANPGVFGPSVLIEPGLPPKDEGEATPEQIAVYIERSQRRRHTFADRAAADAAYRTRDPFGTWLPEVFDLYLQHGFEDLPDGKVRLKFSQETELAYYREGLLTDPWPYLAKVDVPVLFIRGTESTIFRTRDKAEAIVAAIPTCRLVEIPGATHSIPMEQPERVVEVAREFFRKT